MDAEKLARWTRFALKGGIGKCTAIRDCAAERPEDLMFLKNDEVIVLMQIEDEEGVFLGYCEGIVGRFQGIHVNFHGKMKIPFMTKRSSSSSAKIASNRSSKTMSPSAPAPPVESPRVDVASLPKMTSSPLSTYEQGDSSNPDSRQSPASSPITEDHPILSSATTSTDRPPTSLSAQQTPPTSVSTTPSVQKSSLDYAAEDDHIDAPLETSRVDSPESFYSSQDGHENVPNRVSAAPSDADVGIGMSMLQNFGASDSDDDSSDEEMSTPSPQLTRKLTAPLVVRKNSLANPPQSPTVEDKSPPQIPAPITRIESIKISTSPVSSPQTMASTPPVMSPSSEEWDLYDDYYSKRQSAMSKRSARSSNMSTGSAGALPPPPLPSVNIPPPLPPASIAVVGSAGSTPTDTPTVRSPSIPVVSSASLNRPPPLQSRPSPLLHTSFSSPVTSPEGTLNSFLTITPVDPPLHSPTFGKSAASELRQRLEQNRTQADIGNPVIIEKETFNGNVVVEDDSQVLETASVTDDSVSEQSHKSIKVETILPPMISENTPTSSLYPSGITSPLSALDSPLSSFPLPPNQSNFITATPSPSPFARPLHPLSQSKTSESEGEGSRSSLFLPHPNAPKSSPSRADAPGTMIHRPSTSIPPRQGSGPAPLNKTISVLQHAYQSRVAPDGTFRRVTIYGRCEADLGSSLEPVAIEFSTEPLPPSPPPPKFLKPSPLSLGSGSRSPTSSTIPSPLAANEPLSASALPSSQPNSRSVSPRPPPSLSTPTAQTLSATPLLRKNFNPSAPGQRPRSRSFSGVPTPSMRTPVKQSTLDLPPPSIQLTRDSSGSNFQTPRMLSPTPSASSPSIPRRPDFIPPLEFESTPPSPVIKVDGPRSLRSVHSFQSLNTNRGSARAPLERVNSSEPKRSMTADAQIPSSDKPIGTTSPQTPPMINPSPEPHRSQSTDGVSANPKPVILPGRVASPENTPSEIQSPPSRTSSMARKLSLRNKMSLPSLRSSVQPKQQDRQPLPGTETVQVNDMDFEMVGPAVPPTQSPTVPKMEGRASESSQSSPKFWQSEHLRADSPAVSAGSSQQRSPTLDEFAKPKASDESIEAHRQREQRWMNVLSTVPASQSRKNKKVRKLIHEGVPASVRYRVWANLVDSKARQMEGLYSQLGMRPKVPVFPTIQRDAQRCFPDHPQFLSAHGSLPGLLQAYLTMCPDVQYNVGLCYIAGRLLTMTPEEDAFWSFVSIMDTHLRPWFSINPLQMEIDSSLFSRSVESLDAQLASKLYMTFQLNPVDVVRSWFCCIFSETLPVDHLDRVWDLFLLEGVPLLYRVGLSVLYCCRQALLSAPNPEAALFIIRRPPANLLPPSVEQFVSLVLTIKLKDEDVRKQRIKMEKQIKRRTQTKSMSGPSVSISGPR